MEPRALIDLRSDTVTRPCPGMRRAIAAAEVGDDVLGDDPTTRRLEEVVAERLGKDRALFFPSGVMANQVAMALLGGWGGEVLLEANAHILHYEEGASAALSGVQLRTVPTPDGMVDAERVRDAIREPSPFVPQTRALALENTHLGSGGRIMPVGTAEEIREVTDTHGIAIHLDGARLWHAVVETGLEATSWTRHADTVMVALSKGLGCPVGSLLAGDRGLMEEAWRVRRRFGGGMRQSGVLAAAGLYALEHHLSGLANDHAHARALAEGFDALPGLRASVPETNIVLVEVEEGADDPERLLSFLETHRILMLRFGRSTLRAVTHRDVDEPGIRHILAVLQTWGEGGERARGMA